MSHGNCKRCEPDRVEADDGGAVIFETVPTGRACVFFVRADGYPGKVFRVELPDGEDLEGYELVLDRGVPVDLTVVDYVSGEALAGVGLRDSSLGEVVATSDASGRIRTALNTSTTSSSTSACPIITSQVGAPTGCVPTTPPRAYRRRSSTASRTRACSSSRRSRWRTGPSRAARRCSPA